MAPAGAQSCSSLTISGSGQPGTDLTIALSGADADSFAMMAVGMSTGKTELKFGPLGTLTLGLDRPFAFLPLGVTDGNGDLKAVISLPPGSLPQVMLHAQAVTAQFGLNPPGPPSLKFCTSNVEAFSIG